MSEFAGPIETPLASQTIGSYFDDIANRYPDNLAVVQHQKVRWTYKQYQQHIDELAIGLLELGIKPGDRVGIWSPNNIEWCLTQFATAKIGAVMVCINPAYRPEELQYHNILNNGLLVAEAMKLTCDDKLCIPVPKYHC
ncbi:acyl-CoA synthase [Shewanella benthica KT99]|uniref:Acyl-CoA synthase n=1 Tax=Shewanella benthica KT99 TaxID=314608 RepID=A9CZ74_9GAMM|nr:acyl-CoA synthase [Shewanella benthica KT99]